MSEHADPWLVPLDTVASTAEFLMSRLTCHATPALLDAYFDPDTGFTGRAFEEFGAGHHGPNEIGCHDLLSLQLLDVALPGWAVLELTDGGLGRSIEALLPGIADTDIWSGEASEALTGATQIWQLLTARPGLGPTITSKLLSRKRPRLVPITDGVVRLVPKHPGVDYWQAFRTVLARHPTAREQLGKTRSLPAVPGHVSALRTLDVVIWMHESKQGRRFADELTHSHDVPSRAG